MVLDFSRTQAKVKKYKLIITYWTVRTNMLVPGQAHLMLTGLLIRYQNTTEHDISLFCKKNILSRYQTDYNTAINTPESKKKGDKLLQLTKEL